MPEKKDKNVHRFAVRGGGGHTGREKEKDSKSVSQKALCEMHYTVKSTINFKRHFKHF